jgi:hypothetical protein
VQETAVNETTTLRRPDRALIDWLERAAIEYELHEHDLAKARRALEARDVSRS